MLNEVFKNKNRIYSFFFKFIISFTSRLSYRTHLSEIKNLLQNNIRPWLSNTRYEMGHITRINQQAHGYNYLLEWNQDVSKIFRRTKFYRNWIMFCSLTFVLFKIKNGFILKGAAESSIWCLCFTNSHCCQRIRNYSQRVEFHQEWIWFNLQI